MLSVYEALLNNNIHVDFDEELLYGSDQLCFSYPKRFPTVNMCLVCNEALGKIADEIRNVDGNKQIPFFTEKGEFGEDYDPYGYYNFYFGLNTVNEYKVDRIITFTVSSDIADDDGEEYFIELSLEEQKLMYECIDRQFRMELGKSANDVLAEAEKEMERE